ncbi:hypothetical protein A28LD_1902 [Idiomarina sp. A28L]|uniref:ribosome biogenesis factor YjgA n=1 Tax=Idiomarina sp. A28L TaxID=1036674 RepID=UPI0002138838|nr:ribosome biogenesis factor YjgA [Idiomarina sp. A28L]EGN74885.1 hypothetical protein A28LD_1902 [Idiomarina sp. A28L]
MQRDNQDEHLDDGDLSKTQLKRHSQDMHDLGVKLVKMGSNGLKQIPLDDETFAAVKLAKKIENKREGYRRQLQLVAKLLRQRDTAPILAAIDELENRALYQAAHFHALEKWRDRVINQGDDAIQELLDVYPHGDRQQLRQYARQAAKELEQNKPPAASRALFKYIRSLSESST